jgi:hypothetical protein
MNIHPWLEFASPIPSTFGTRTRSGAKMIDVSLKGIRCRAAAEILEVDGAISAATEGTIIYELEGEGGQLVNVHWDNGTRSLVSSEEIVITDAVTWQ